MSNHDILIVAKNDLAPSVQECLCQKVKEHLTVRLFLSTSYQAHTHTQTTTQSHDLLKECLSEW